MNKSNYIRELETKYVIFSHTCFVIAPEIKKNQTFLQSLIFLFVLFLANEVKNNNQQNQVAMYLYNNIEI